jgi:hypothetical protein
MKYKRHSLKALYKKLLKANNIFMKMQPYFQSTPFTTAASSLLTILHHLAGTPRTKEQEFKIWKHSANLPTRGSSIYALASYAQQQGLNPKVIVESKAYSFPDYRFYRYKKEDVEHAAYSDNLHFQHAQKSNVQIEERPLSFAQIKQLAKKNILLLRVNAKPIRQEKRNSSQYIVVHGYENGYFHVIDPAHAAFSLPESVMQEACTSLGSKKYRDQRAIIFQR